MEAQAGYVKAVPASVRFINEDMVRLASVLVYVFQETLILMRAQRKTLEAEVTSLEISKEIFVKLNNLRAP